MEDAVISGDIVGALLLVGVGFLAMKLWEYLEAERAKSLSGEFCTPITLPGRPNLTARVYYSGFTKYWDLRFLGEDGKADLWDKLSSAERERASAQIMTVIRKSDSRYPRS